MRLSLSRCIPSQQSQRLSSHGNFWRNHQSPAFRFVLVRMSISINLMCQKMYDGRANAKALRELLRQGCGCRNRFESKAYSEKLIYMGGRKCLAVSSEMFQGLSLHAKIGNRLRFCRPTICSLCRRGKSVEVAWAS